MLQGLHARHVPPPSLCCALAARGWVCLNALASVAPSLQAWWPLTGLLRRRAGRPAGTAARAAPAAAGGACRWTAQRTHTCGGSGRRNGERPLLGQHVHCRRCCDAPFRLLPARQPAMACVACWRLVCSASSASLPRLPRPQRSHDPPVCFFAARSHSVASCFRRHSCSSLMASHLPLPRPATSCHDTFTHTCTHTHCLLRLQAGCQHAARQRDEPPRRQPGQQRIQQDARRGRLHPPGRCDPSVHFVPLLAATCRMWCPPAPPLCTSQAAFPLRPVSLPATFAPDADLPLRLPYAARSRRELAARSFRSQVRLGCQHQPAAGAPALPARRSVAGRAAGRLRPWGLDARVGAGLVGAGLVGTGLVGAGRSA